MALVVGLIDLLCCSGFCLLIFDILSVLCFLFAMIQSPSYFSDISISPDIELPLVLTEMCLQVSEPQVGFKCLVGFERLFYLFNLSSCTPCLGSF